MSIRRHGPTGPRRDYFVFSFPLSDAAWERYDVGRRRDPRSAPGPSRRTDPPAWPTGSTRIPTAAPPAAARGAGRGLLLALRTLNQALRHVAEVYFHRDNPGALDRARRWAAQRLGADSVDLLHRPSSNSSRRWRSQLAGLVAAADFLTAEGPVAGLDRATLEMLLLFLNVPTRPPEEPAELFDDDELRRRRLVRPLRHRPGGLPGPGEAPGSRGHRPVPPAAGAHAGQPRLPGRPDRATSGTTGPTCCPTNLLASLQCALDVLAEVDVARAAAPGPAAGPGVSDPPPGTPTIPNPRPSAATPTG